MSENTHNETNEMKPTNLDKRKKNENIGQQSSVITIIK